MVLNDHHEWVDGVYTRVGEPRVWIGLEDPAYVAWEADALDALDPLARLLVWAALEKPWGTWDNTSNPVCSTRETLGACVQLKYTIDKYGCTGAPTSITYTDRSGVSQHIPRPGGHPYRRA